MASWDISHKTTSDVPNQPPKDISKRPFLTHAIHPNHFSPPIDGHTTISIARKYIYTQF